MRIVPDNYLGFSITLVSISLFIILFIVSYEYGSLAHSYCSAPYCSTFSHIPWESYIGFSLLTLSGIFGVYLALTPRKTEQVQTITKSKLDKTVKTLAGEEKKLYEQIAKDGGSSFQTDLIKITGFSKVKVSRVLDKLETKGLVERRRRGMSNIIVLK